MPRVNNPGFPIKPKGAVHTRETIYARVVEEGDCWVWQGSYSHKAPVIRHMDKVVPVRRFIAEHLQGKSVANRFVTTTCGNMNCVCPEHVIVVTRSKLQKLTAERTMFHIRPDRRMKLQLAAQRRFQRPVEQIEAIRNATGSTRQIAREMGINLSVVQKIRNGISYSTMNPFAGLIR